MLKSQGLVIVRGNALAIILYFYGVESLVLESYVCIDCVSRAYTLPWLGYCGVPMLVAPASRLFSTSSFTTEHKSTMTWPDWI